MSRFRIDWWLVIPSLMLCCISLVILRGTAPELVLSQAVFICISLAIFLLVARIDYKIFFAIHPWMYLLSILLLTLPLIFGAINRGATRWIQIGSFSLQPSELIKPFLIITFVSLAISRKSLSLLWLALAVLIPAILIFLQPDLGTVLVILIGWLTIIISKTSLKVIASVAFIGLLCLAPVYKFVLHDYQRDRINTFVNPYADPLGKGYHVIQSMIATGSGKVAGRGLGHGPQSLLRFLPEHTTDFIFASLSESFGFVGAGFVLILYVILLRRLYDISKTATDPKVALFCMSALTIIAFQVWINVGMNIGIAPVTGITLPLLSRGGSSLLSVAILLGLASSMSHSGKNHVYSV